MNRSIIFCLFLVLVSGLLIETGLAQQADKIRMCDIVGIVEKTGIVTKSPWSDGTPSILSTDEMHISVLISDRTPHDKDAPAEDPCHKEVKGEIRTYKLCSPTSPKPGDRIHGTEGTQTGSPDVFGCLFDLIILPETP